MESISDDCALRLFTNMNEVLCRKSTSIMPAARIGRNRRSTLCSVRNSTGPIVRALVYSRRTQKFVCAREVADRLPISHRISSTRSRLIQSDTWFLEGIVERSFCSSHRYYSLHTVNIQTPSDLQLEPLREGTAACKSSISTETRCSSRAHPFLPDDHS